MTSKRAAYTDSQNLGAKGRSDLQIFKDLEHWIAVKTDIKMWFPQEGVAIRYVDSIITDDLDALHPDTVINDHEVVFVEKNRLDHEDTWERIKILTRHSYH